VATRLGPRAPRPRHPEDRSCPGGVGSGDRAGGPRSRGSSGAEEPRESGPLRPGALDAEGRRLPVRSFPRLEWGVALGRGGDEPLAQPYAHVIHRRGDRKIRIGVDADGQLIDPVAVLSAGPTRRHLSRPKAVARMDGGEHASGPVGVEAPFENLPGTSIWLAEVCYDPETATVRLSPPGPPRLARWGSPPNRCLGRNFWRRRAGSFRAGWGSVRLRRPKPATARRPGDESTSGPEGEDDHPGTGKPGTGATASKPEGSALKT